MVDLDALLSLDSPLHLVYAYSINRRGEIAVNGIDANGNEQAALLVPCDEDHQGVEGCDYSMVDAVITNSRTAPRASLPTTENLRHARGRKLAPYLRRLVP